MLSVEQSRVLGWKPPYMHVRHFTHLLQKFVSISWRPRYEGSRTSSLFGQLLCVCYMAMRVRVGCVMIRLYVRVYGYVRVYVFVCSHPTLQLIFFGVFRWWFCRIISSVSHRPSGCPTPYFMADTVQQRSLKKFMWTTTFNVALTLHMSVH